MKKFLGLIILLLALWALLYTVVFAENEKTNNSPEQEIKGLAIVGPIVGNKKSRTASDEFNEQFLKQRGTFEQSIAPELIQTDNPLVKPYAAIIQAARWETPSIFVCWENPSAKYAAAMEWTQDAVQRTWEKASALTFKGWQKCAPANAGIRIQIADDGPHVKTLGHYLDKMPDGMVLNFTFHNWSQGCQAKLEHCVRAIAVHEFGHALGFTHEQNRPDAPGECKPLRQGSDPDTALTPYDEHSAMNYCNKNWNNDGILSPLDIVAIQTLYGKK